MRPGLLPIAAALLASCSSCSDTIHRRVCELECDKDRFRHHRTCEMDFRDCRLGCGGFGDGECITGCESAWTDCVLGHSEEECLRACPCWSTFDGCWTGCGGDYDCQDACNASYEQCLGVDPAAVRECFDACDFAADLCLVGCDESHLDVDWSAWVRCQYDCYDSQLDCNICCL